MKQTRAVDGTIMQKKNNFLFKIRFRFVVPIQNRCSYQSYITLKKKKDLPENTRLTVVAELVTISNLDVQYSTRLATQL